MSEVTAASLGFDPVATQLWNERFARFAATNSSVTAFCAAEGIAKSGFFHWRRRLAPTHAKPDPAKPNPAKPIAAKTAKPALVPLRVTAAPASITPIELVLPAGTILRFPSGTGPELIVAILRGLEERPC